MKCILVSCAFFLFLANGMIPEIASAQTTMADWGAGPAAAAVSQTDGIVTCSGPDCNVCSFVNLINEVVNWLISLGVLAVVIRFVILGVRMVISAGSTNLDKIKEIASDTVIGFLLILGAWLFIDTVLKLTTTTGGLEAWGVVECGGAVGPIAGQPTLTGGNTAFNSSAPMENCPNCVSLTERISCKNNCALEENFAEGVVRLTERSGIELEMTEGFPPTRTHKAACHGDGTCADIVFKDRVFTTERVNALQRQAQSVGCRAVYEPARGGSCDGVTGECLPFSKTGATGNHFSYYCN